MQREKLISRLMNVTALLAVIYLLNMLGNYGLYDGYLDHGEPIVAAAAFKMLDGASVYPPFDGPNFTSNVYGPYLYLVNGLFLGVFGGSAWSGKISGLIAIFISVILVWRSYRALPHYQILLAVIFMVAFIVLFVPYSIWNRPDPMLVMAVAASVLIIRVGTSLPRWVNWVVLGGLGGVALGFKIYGPLFFIPVGMYVAIRDKSITSLLVMSVVGFTTALLPFVLEEFPLTNLLAWFSAVAEKPNDGAMVTKALRYGVFFLLPAIVLLLQRIMMLKSLSKCMSDAETVYALLTFFCAGFCVMLAAKPGAGMYYLLPIAPLSIDMMMRIIDNTREEYQYRTIVAGAILVAAMLVTAVPVQKRFFRALEWDRTTSIKMDLHKIMQAHPGKSIQMAVGSTIAGYHNTLQKTELIYAGNPYTVDFGVMIETSYIGILPSDSLIQSFIECGTDVWLVPKDEEPLEMIGYYGNKIVDVSMRNAFMEAYIKSSSSAYFDLWTCRGD